MNEEAFELVQTKIAYLERAVSELSDVIFRQHQEIDSLQARLKAVSDRLSGIQGEEGPRPPEQERPPHY